MSNTENGEWKWKREQNSRTIAVHECTRTCCFRTWWLDGTCVSGIQELIGSENSLLSFCLCLPLPLPLSLPLSDIRFYAWYSVSIHSWWTSHFSLDKSFLGIYRNWYFAQLLLYNLSEFRIIHFEIQNTLSGFATKGDHLFEKYSVFESRIHQSIQQP